MPNISLRVAPVEACRARPKLRVCTKCASGPHRQFLAGLHRLSHVGPPAQVRQPSERLKHDAKEPSKPDAFAAPLDPDDPESLLRYEKTVSLLYDLREQGARVLALANAGDATIESLATDIVAIEPANESLLPIAEVVPLQLFAYFMAVAHGVDVDHPRNLTKAVVAE